MNVIVRFYWQHDLDLVALAMHPDFDMGPQFKRAVIAYARGDEEFRIPLPRSMPYRVELDNCCTHFRLTPGKDDDVIEFLNGFRTGFRNSIMKQIFRQFLEGIYMDPYLNEDTFRSKSRVHGKPASKSESSPLKRRTEAQPVKRIQKKIIIPPVDKTISNETLPLSAVSADIETAANSTVHPASTVTEKTAEKAETTSIEAHTSAIITDMKTVEPIIDLAEEETGFEDGDGFDLFSSVGSMMQ